MKINVSSVQVRTGSPHTACLHRLVAERLMAAVIDDWGRDGTKRS
jgi:hypothetical protein